MYTIEHEAAYTLVTYLDEKGEKEDLQLILEGNGVLLRQFDSDREEYDLIHLSTQQFKDLIESLSKTEGVYYEK